MTTEFLQQNKIKLISQPPYSPDTNMLNPFLFRNFEMARSKSYFHDNEEIVTYLDTFLN